MHDAATRIKAIPGKAIIMAEEVTYHVVVYTSSCMVKSEGSSILNGVIVGSKLLAFIAVFV